MSLFASRRFSRAAFSTRLLAAVAFVSVCFPAARAQVPSSTSAIAGDASYRAQGIEVLSDTQGVDFSPYIKNILQTIRQKWIPLIPIEARPPTSAKAATLIRFTIGRDGTLTSMHLDGSTHNDAFNRAAWGAITAASKYPPLPAAFTGPSLEMRLKFLVNNPSSEAPDPPSTSPAGTGLLHP